MAGIENLIQRRENHLINLAYMQRDAASDPGREWIAKETGVCLLLLCRDLVTFGLVTIGAAAYVIIVDRLALCVKSMAR
jgi:hypothetical protein